MLLLPALASAGDRVAPPRTGLMWLRSSLPAVFPLQIKTGAGHDYYLTLVHGETGHETLAAYIAGGEFFRVLVPPGGYRLHVAYGAQWQDEETLFGPQTRFFELAESLRFETRGLGTKAGHLVDLRDLIRTQEARSVTPLGICQRFGADLTGSALSPPAFLPLTDDPDAPRPRLRFEVSNRICG